MLMVLVVLGENQKSVKFFKKWAKTKKSDFTKAIIIGFTGTDFFHP